MEITGKRPKSIGTILRRAADFHEPVYPSTDKLCQHYAGFCDGLTQILGNLSYIGRVHLGIEPRMPAISVLSQDVLNLEYEQALAHIQEVIETAAHELREGFIDQHVGTVDWSRANDTCTFSYQEFERRHGILRNRLSHTMHKHSLTHARLRRLDDRDVRLPKKAQAIVNDLLPCLREELRVVTGNQVVREVGEREDRSEYTALGKGVLGAGRAAAAFFTSGAGKAVSGATMAAGALGAAAMVFLSDPGLLLGDLVLYGWDNE